MQCAHGRRPHPGQYVVTSGTPGGPDGYHTAGACQKHLDVARRAAARTTNGQPVHITQTKQTTVEPQQTTLFGDDK